MCSCGQDGSAAFHTRHSGFRAVWRLGDPAGEAFRVSAQRVLDEAAAALGAAMEAAMVSREQDRLVFRELFEAYFRDPEARRELLPGAAGLIEPPGGRPRVREALAPQQAFGSSQSREEDPKTDFDAAMTASELQWLRHADFDALSASEYGLVERLAREVALPVPSVSSRRTRPGSVGNRMYWPGVMHHAARTAGEMLCLQRLQRREQPLPLLMLVDVSGSMERYARLLQAFLHAATFNHRRRDVFAFGTRLTDLTPAFRMADTDAMLAAASAAIEDFAGGTRLGESVASLRRQHARRLVGHRTLVLVISDGLDTGEPKELAHELAWLRRHSRRLLWLNPLLRFHDYAPTARGAAVLHAHAHGMLAVHNSSCLQDLAASVREVMTR